MLLLSTNDLWFVDDDLWRISICDAYNAVIICELYNFIKKNDIQSFMYFSYEDVNICNKFRRLSYLADIKGLHSGASYGCTMRIVEDIIKKGFLCWKYEYIQEHHSHIIDKIVLIQKNYKKAISNPNYKMCKKRLEKEYFELVIDDACFNLKI